MDSRIAYLISFLALLVHRHGGELTIEHISDLSGHDLDLEMAIDQKRDLVVLRVAEKPDPRTNGQAH